MPALIIRPPFTSFRRGIGLLAALGGAFTLLTTSGSGLAALVPLLAGSVFTVRGVCVALLERIVTVEGGRARVEWRLAGWTRSRRDVDLGPVDRVAIAARREPFIQGDQGTMWVADRSFPVLLLAGETPVLRVIGWDPAPPQGRFPVESSLYSPAFFPSHAQHVAARLAQTLSVPLIVQVPGEEATFAPECIPAEWLNPASVSFRMAWHRLGT